MTPPDFSLDDEVTLFGFLSVAIPAHSRDYKTWITYFARFGYAAKGTLYGGVGVLALPLLR
jgi:hypothetical protein